MNADSRAEGKLYDAGRIPFQMSLDFAVLESSSRYESRLPHVHCPVRLRFAGPFVRLAIARCLR